MLQMVGTEEAEIRTLRHLTQVPANMREGAED
jgi:hypothetical protein